jgi:hypothetical protein
MATSDNQPMSPQALLEQQVQLLHEIKESLNESKKLQERTSAELRILGEVLERRVDKTRVSVSNVSIPMGSLILLSAKLVVALLVIGLALGVAGGILWGLLWLIALIFRYPLTL